MRTLYKDIPYKLEIGVLEMDGKFASGLTVQYELTKADGSFVTSGVSAQENEIYTFDYTFTELDEYRLKWITPPTYDNGFENILVLEEIAASGLTIALSGIQFDITQHRLETEERIKWILGLNQENYTITGQVYDVNNLLTSSVVTIYTDTTLTNVLRQYTMSATYDVNGLLMYYSMVESTP